MTPDESQTGSGRWYRLTLGGLCAGDLIWNGYRASTLSITHDEAFTYLWYVAKGPRGIYSPNGYLANNHFLLFAACLVQRATVRCAEWALRLPSVLTAFSVDYTLPVVQALHVLQELPGTTDWEGWSDCRFKSDPPAVEYRNVPPMGWAEGFRWK